MFTEKDFIHYFDQIRKMEHEMYTIYKNLYDRLIEPEYKKIFRHMADEEKAHDAMIVNLKNEFIR